MLWQRVLDERVAHSLWERLRRIISILLAVTIALLIALSVARPELEWLTGKTQHIVIVLDTSPSMNARTADGSTRWQHAIEKARTLVDSGGNHRCASAWSAIHTDASGSGSLMASPFPA